MNDNNIEDLFGSNAFIEMIANRMDIIDELKNRLPKKSKEEELTFLDKLFFKRVLKDITDIEVSDKSLKVYFDRGVRMYIDSASTSVEEYNNNIGNVDYRTFKIIGELVELGEIHLKTSPFVVEMTKNELISKYKDSLDEELFNLDHSINLHDSGINCWGGWGGPIRSNYDELNLEESLIFITQRMQQLNIDDFARNIDRMSTLIKNVYRNKPLNLNPINLARLIVEYDLQDNLINGVISNYFDKGYDGNLEILYEIKTNINYNIFIEMVRELRDNYMGDKPKIKLKRSDQ